MHKLIVLERLDGSGKSTVAKALQEEYPNLQIFSEPYGILGDFLRQHGKGFDKMTKMLLFAAARREFVQKTLIPALEKGDVLLDRFTASTYAYQHYGDGTDLEAIERAMKTAIDGLQPIDLTTLLKVSKDVREERMRAREKHDRLDDYQDEYYSRIADNYNKAIELTGTKAYTIIDADQSVDEIVEQITPMLKSLIKN